MTSNRVLICYLTISKTFSSRTGKHGDRKESFYLVCLWNHVGNVALSSNDLADAGKNLESLSLVMIEALLEQIGTQEQKENMFTFR